MQRLQRFKDTMHHQRLPVGWQMLWKAGIAMWDRCSGAIAKEMNPADLF